MLDKDVSNIEFLKSNVKADDINKQFYEKFNYPWPATSFLSINDNSFINILNQEIGDFTHNRIPEKAKIWVAGCGTNQALITALRFPSAQVLGTDISTTSLELCNNNAQQIGVKNLILEEKSINDVIYKEEFDYIICTGVIHHNADPKYSLNKISSALKRDGIFEFMVYNYYHRILVTAFQKGIRELITKDGFLNFDKEVEIAKRLIDNFPKQNLMGLMLTEYKDSHISRMADDLLQPIETSYTVNTLNELVTECNLQLLLPCVNQFDKINNTYDWNIGFDDPLLKNMYENLDDLQRWQITNLFMLNNAPMLWFYTQRQDSNYSRKTEREVCQDFLKRKFKKVQIKANLYTTTKDGKLQSNNNQLTFPGPLKSSKKLIRELYENISPDSEVDQILSKMGLKLSHNQINEIRLNLTTIEFPYLQSIS